MNRLGRRRSTFPWRHVGPANLAEPNAILRQVGAVWIAVVADVQIEGDSLGTPVILVSTTNENRSHNRAPMPSAFWLGWRSLLGFEAISKIPQNLIRTGECVFNLRSVGHVEAVNRLAYPTTDPGARGRRSHAGR